MSVAEFKAFLLQLAALYDDAGRPAEADGLQNLAQVFDAGQNHKIAKFIEEIRRVREIQPSSVKEAEAGS